MNWIIPHHRLSFRLCCGRTEKTHAFHIAHLPKYQSYKCLSTEPATMASAEITKSYHLRDDQVVLSELIFSYSSSLESLMMIKDAIRVMDSNINFVASDRPLVFKHPSWNRPDEAMDYCENMIRYLTERLERHMQNPHPESRPELSRIWKEGVIEHGVCLQNLRERFREDFRALIR